MNDMTFSGSGGGAPARMTSEEIADLVGARHDSVRRTIERLAEKGVITLPPTVEKPTAGRPSLLYVFEGEAGKRDSYVVVAQLSPEFTARLVDRWQELEQRQPVAIDVRNLPQLQTIALQLIEVNKEQSEQIAAMAPKVEAFDRIADAEGSLCITDGAKALQMRPIDLTRELQAMDWIYRRPGNKHWVGKSAQTQQNLLTHKVTTGSRADGSEWVSEQVRITPKGLAKLAARFSEGRA